MSDNQVTDQRILYPLIAIIVGLIGNVLNIIVKVQALVSTIGFFAFTLLIGVGVIGVFVQQNRIKPKDGILYAVIWMMFIALSGTGYLMLVAQPITVSGRILDNINQRNPVNGVEISLYHYNSGTIRQVLTNAEGGFQFGEVRDGEYDLIINGINIYSGDIPIGIQKLLNRQIDIGRFYFSNIFGVQPSITPTQPSNTPTVHSKNDCIHQVQSGDTLSKLSLNYGISIADIISANNLDISANIYPKQRILIPQCGTTNSTPPPTTSPRPAPNWTPISVELPEDDTSKVTNTPIPSNTSWTPQQQEFDGVMMVLVPAGQFTMGSTKDQVDYALKLCINANLGEGMCERYMFEDEEIRTFAYEDYVIIDS